MNAADTSAVVAAFASWHEHHRQAQAALDAGLRVIDHCALETYSVLTRLPPPHRCPGTVVRDFLRLRFAEPFLRLDERAYREFLLALPEHAVAGGSAYDALVAATAAAHAATLVTCDRRAASVYESYGVRASFLG
ncbi:MAG TPA: PIN domain-containing protein [Steroidobacteraceae bacterium]|nr:PIN domain-containing protein [Steroidobacteraceae bacterium]